MFAVVEIAGKQFKVSKGDILEVPKLKDTKEGDKVKVASILLKSDAGKTEIGTPSVEGAQVDLKILEHGKGDKIIVFKMKPKKRYQKKQGHRQAYTKVEVVGVK